MAETTMDSASPPQDGKPRRAYKACLHCRKRKAKCDLGDIDHPREPPCRRCAREGVECTFAESRRGGRASFLKGQLEKEDSLPAILQSGSSAFLSARPPDADFHPFPSSSSVKPYQSPPSPGGVTVFDDDSSNPNKRRRHSSAARPDPLDPKSLAEASLQNPTDALEILALASADVRSGHSLSTRNGAEDRQAHSPAPSESAGPEGRPHASKGEQGTFARLLNHSPFFSQSSLPTQVPRAGGFPRAPSPQHLSSHPLIAASVITFDQLRTYVHQFFVRHHHIFPVVPASRIPRTDEQLAQFAFDENHLVTAMVVVASRHDAQNPQVHDLSWEYMQVRITKGQHDCGDARQLTLVVQTLLQELVLGKGASVGAVEALLLLSEYLPRPTEPDQLSGQAENAMAWMLVGMVSPSLRSQSAPHR
jgi:hypothetical protein